MPPKTRKLAVVKNHKLLVSESAPKPERRKTMKHVSESKNKRQDKFMIHRQYKTSGIKPEFFDAFCGKVDILATDRCRAAILDPRILNILFGGNLSAPYAQISAVDAFNELYSDLPTEVIACILETNSTVHEQYKPYIDNMSHYFPRMMEMTAVINAPAQTDTAPTRLQRIREQNIRDHILGLTYASELRNLHPNQFINVGPKYNKGTVRLDELRRQYKNDEDPSEIRDNIIQNRNRTNPSRISYAILKGITSSSSASTSSFEPMPTLQNTLIGDMISEFKSAHDEMHDIKAQIEAADEDRKHDLQDELDYMQAKLITRHEFKRFIADQTQFMYYMSNYEKHLPQRALAAMCLFSGLGGTIHEFIKMGIVDKHYRIMATPGQQCLNFMSQISTTFDISTAKRFAGRSASILCIITPVGLSFSYVGTTPTMSTDDQFCSEREFVIPSGMQLEYIGSGPKDGFTIIYMKLIGFADITKADAVLLHQSKSAEYGTLVNPYLSETAPENVISELEFSSAEDDA